MLVHLRKSGSSLKKIHGQSIKLKVEWCAAHHKIYCLISDKLNDGERKKFHRTFYRDKL